MVTRPSFLTDEIIHQHTSFYCEHSTQSEYILTATFLNEAEPARNILSNIVNPFHFGATADHVDRLKPSLQPNTISKGNVLNLTVEAPLLEVLFRHWTLSTSLVTETFFNLNITSLVLLQLLS